MKRIGIVLAAGFLATAVAFPARADDTSRLASQYATWAGGKSNADSLVKGLRTGSSITLVTISPDKTKSIAGFTAQTSMSPEEISGALASAKSSLARMGIRQPSADQIQAALIGGEIEMPNGRSRLVQGSVALRQEPTLSPVASR
ncbi:MAG TPA: hypothetical protein VM073_12135 [Usitatibacter sp.]|nr:hypothetical protein [Usitatibacter sp.]